MSEHAKLIKIGNSQGIRLPKRLVSKYGLGELVILEELSDGIFLHAANKGKLSWEDTYKEMAQEEDEWSDWQELDIDQDDYL
ncbi:MAG: AbrB/MazE/SpoVT family DNA-binding domain-containing protein [Gammaproteobacteria bacterium]|nr:AbrB/MazE/SpoVT family DNA-binding domain-containing protein [Gammaproteobacteria bacterium]